MDKSADTAPAPRPPLPWAGWHALPMASHGTSENPQSADRNSAVHKCHAL